MQSNKIIKKVKRKLSSMQVVAKDSLIDEKDSQESGELSIDLKIQMNLTESFDSMVSSIESEYKRKDYSKEEIEEEILSQFLDGEYAEYIDREEIESKVYKEFKYSDEVDLDVGDIDISLNVGSRDVNTVAEARKKVENVILDVRAVFKFRLNYELIDKIQKEIVKNILA